MSDSDIVVDADQIAIEKSVAEELASAPVYLVIENAAQADEVAGWLKKTRALRERIATFFDPMQNGAYKVWKDIVARRKQIEQPSVDLEERLKRALGQWKAREEERVAEEQRRLDEEARQAAIAKAALDGDKGTVKGIESGKIAVASTVAAKPVQAVKGVSQSTLWRAEITDKPKLIRAILAGKFPLDWIEFDMQAIESVVRHSKGQVTIPGVTARKVTSTAIR